MANNRRSTPDEFIEFMRQHRMKQEALPPEKAKEEARRFLTSIGFLDEEGNMHYEIVNGHFFGW